MLNKLNKSQIRIVLILVGLFSVIWFLIRVIPKPSRATYPCQRAAFPFASGFVIWVIGIFSGKYFLEKTKNNFLGSKYLLAITFLAASIVSFSLITFPFSSLNAGIKIEKEVFVPTDRPNSPIGIAKGIFLGRVVWCYNPNATNWSGFKSDADAEGNKVANSSENKWFLVFRRQHSPIGS